MVPIPRTRACGISGNTLLLHGRVESSNLSESTLFALSHDAYKLSSSMAERKTSDFDAAGSSPANVVSNASVSMRTFFFNKRWPMATHIVRNTSVILTSEMPPVE